MSQLFTVNLPDGLIQAGEELESFGRDSRPDHTPVSGFAETGDQASSFQAVEEAGDIGIAGNHPAGNLAGRETFRRPAQDAQDVVLRRREVLVLDDVS